MRYAKLKNGVLTFAPKNKGNIMNYDINVEEMTKDGYKPFVEAVKEEGKNYEFSYKETETKIIEIATEIIPDYQAELRQAKEQKIKEASDKAFQYRNKTGLVSFWARPVNYSENTIKLHTELLNQNDFFQIVMAFRMGFYTEDIIYTTKEDIPVYLNEQEAKDVYYKIIGRANKLWNTDYLNYKSLIEAAETIEDVNNIEINYVNEE